MSDRVTIEYQIIAALRQISQAVDTYSRFLWQEYGLTSPQLAALREIARLDGVAPGVLADLIHVSPPTIAGILNRLERRGLVSRSRSVADRRSVAVRVTDEGRRVLAAAPPLLRDRFSDELNRLQPWERTQMLATLQRVAHMMNARDREVAPFLFHPPAGDAPRAAAAVDVEPAAAARLPLGKVFGETEAPS